MTALKSARTVPACEEQPGFQSTGHDFTYSRESRGNGCLSVIPFFYMIWPTSLGGQILSNFMTYRNFLFCLTAMTLVLPVISTPTKAETLDQAIASAISKHPTLEQAIAAQRAAREMVTEERSAYFPKLTASTSAGRVYGDNATSRGLSVTRGAAYSWMWEGSLGVNQTIFDGFHTQNMIGAARARELSALATLADAREALSMQTALSYLNVLRTRESMAALHTYMKTLDEYSARIRAMVDEGAADEAEYQQAETIKLEVRNLIAGFEGQVQGAAAEFAKLTGHLPDEAMERPADLAKLLPPSAGDAIASIWTIHPKVLQSNQEIIAAGFSADSEKSSLYPKITGELSAYIKDVKDEIGGEVEDNRALIRANWEFSTGGAELARIRRAKEQYIASKAKKNEVLRNLEATLRLAYADLDSASAQKRVLAERLSANEKLLETYRVQFEGAKVRILQLLQSENQILNAKLDFLNADYRELAAQYAVMGNLGQLQQALIAGQENGQH